MRWALAAAVLGLSACGPVDIVVAQAGMPDGGRPMHDQPCTLDSECRPMEFCERSSCDALSGRCRPRPVFCDPMPAPVCGCNGVTYWNDCLRKASGQAASLSGECASAVTCSDDQACPDPRASCARLVGEASACGGASVGACWVLPPSCPPGNVNAGAWAPCGGGACLDVCQAIRSEAPHHRCP